MGIRCKPSVLAKLLPEIVKISFAKPAFQKRPGIDPRRGMSLEINNIGRFTVFSPRKKWLKATSSKVADEA
jgi:hypothetical protein